MKPFRKLFNDWLDFSQLVILEYQGGQGSCCRQSEGILIELKEAVCGNPGSNR